MSEDESAWPEEWEHANREAYLALSGMRADPAGCLAELLRSEVPISGYLRKAMARALLGEQYEGCLRLNLVGLGHGIGSPAGNKKARRDIEIGRWVQKRHSETGSQNRAWLDAAEHFHLSDATCRDAFRFVQKMDKWIDDHPEKDIPAFCSAVPHVWEGVLQEMYFQNLASQPKKPSKKSSQK